jgi:hypothetical protein
MTSKRNIQKRRKESNDSFAFFKKATTEIFQFLITDFGFSYVETLEHIPDCVIKYQNRTTGIYVDYELKSYLSIDIVKLSHAATEVIEDKSYDLLLLMELRHPATDAHMFYGGENEWTNEYLEQLLREYASFLKEHAQDVLTGDFSIFPELKKLSAYYRRQKNKEYFGTYSGGSPRFSERPTLAEVFAGSTDVDPELERLFAGKLNQDKTQSRIYEAYWDHQYSILEIAEFLNRTEESIKRELDDYDDRG